MQKASAACASYGSRILRFIELLAEQSVSLDGALYSYSHPDGVVAHFSGQSLDRKPGPYNVFVAAAQHDVDLAQSWMIGDRETDIECGREAGAYTIRIGTASVHSRANFVERDITAAVSRVLASINVLSPGLACIEGSKR